LASQKRVLNVTTGHHLKRGAVERAFEACAVDWVEKGVSIRNLTLQESILARRVQALEREPLPYAELHGLSYDPSASGLLASKAGAALIRAAAQFVEQA
jgi:hypothetical protein